MELKFSRVMFWVHVALCVVDEGSNGFKVSNEVKVFSCKVWVQEAFHVADKGSIGFKVTNGVNVFVCKVWAHVALLPPPPSVCHRPAITQEGERVLDL